MCKIQNQKAEDCLASLFFLYLNLVNWEEEGEEEVKARNTGLQVKELCLSWHIDQKTKRQKVKACHLSQVTGNYFNSKQARKAQKVYTDVLRPVGSEAVLAENNNCMFDKNNAPVVRFVKI